MKDKSTTPENAISRRHFLLSTSLATAALSFEPLAGIGAPVHESPARADAPGKLCLWYDRPAETWMTEALPIGNGPMGAMLFGGTEIERVQFNEISLWAGTRMAVEGLDDEGQDIWAPIRRSATSSSISAMTSPRSPTTGGNSTSIAPCIR